MDGERLTLDELKVAEVAARNYPRGGTDWVEEGVGCPASSVGRFSQSGVVAPLFALSSVYFSAARWSKYDVTAASFHGGDCCMLYALQASPSWVADVFKAIIDAAEGRNIVRQPLPETTLDKVAVHA